MDYQKRLKQYEAELNAKKAQLAKEAKFYENHPILAGLEWKMIGDRVYIENPQSLRQLLDTMPPSEKTMVIGTARDRFHKVLKTPFRVDLKNPGKISQYHKFQLRIMWKYQGLEICADFTLKTPHNGPHNLPGIESGRRKISDSEHVYYTGVSYKKLQEMTIPCWEFKYPHRITWYGGDQTLTDVSTIAEIIEALQ